MKLKTICPVVLIFWPSLTVMAFETGKGLVTPLSSASTVRRQATTACASLTTLPFGLGLVQWLGRRLGGLTLCGFFAGQGPCGVALLISQPRAGQRLGGRQLRNPGQDHFAGCACSRSGGKIWSLGLRRSGLGLLLLRRNVRGVLRRRGLQARVSDRECQVHLPGVLTARGVVQKLQSVRQTPLRGPLIVGDAVHKMARVAFLRAELLALRWDF